MHNRKQLDDMAAFEFAMLKIKRLQMLQLHQRRAEFHAGIVAQGVTAEAETDLQGETVRRRHRK